MILKRQIVKAIQESASLDDDDKRQIVRIMRRRPRVASYITDEVSIQALEEGLVTLDEPTLDEEGPRQRDWAAFFEALLPFLLALFEFFGFQASPQAVEVLSRAA